MFGHARSSSRAAKQFFLTKNIGIGTATTTNWCVQIDGAQMMDIANGNDDDGVDLARTKARKEMMERAVLVYFLLSFAC